MRTLAIGDVHGCSNMLDALLAAVNLRPTDRLIFLGDYVDRGPDSKGVLDRVIALKKSHSVVTLRGNHELMMLRARQDRAEFKMWCGVGGTMTLGSYGRSPGRVGTFADVPPEHWQFLEKDCVDYVETDHHIFAHAGAEPTTPMNQQGELWLFWEFLTVPIRHVSGKRLIVGHTSQRSGDILDYETIVCIDTYAYGGGYLTCLDVDSNRFWQVNLIGKCRTGVLGHPAERAAAR